MNVRRATEWANQLVGDVEIVELLGEGGLGATYRGRVSTGETIAAKVYHRGVCQDRELRGRLERHYQALKEAQPTGIAQIRELVMHDEALVVVAGWIEGRRVSDALKATGPTDWRKAARTVREVGQAIMCAQETTVVEEAPLPKEFKWTPTGTTVLTDLPITPPRPDLSSVCFVGLTLDRRDYLAPEQLRAAQGQGKVAPESVTYNLCATLFELLSGQTPFSDENELRLMQRILSEEAPLISSLCADVPSGLAVLVEGGLSKEPTDRPALIDLVSELRSFESTRRD